MTNSALRPLTRVALPVLSLLAACSDAAEPSVQSEPANTTPSQSDGLDNVPAPTDTPPSPPVNDDLIIIDGPQEQDPSPAVPTPGTDVDGCASSSAPSSLAEVSLFIALDKSGSMGAGALERRWAPLSEALKAFFADESSRGVSAALQLFPPRLVEQRVQSGCTVEQYVQPDVPVTELPDANEFAAVIDTTELRGGTPMAAVLSAMADKAQAQLALEPQSNVAIVLVTDGYPNGDGCNGQGPQNTIMGTADIAASVADRIPTYVIGLGETLQDMNTVAQAGGTGSAVLASLGDPETTRSTILQRLNEIRREVVSCNVPIPEPPEGRTLEPTKISAQIVHENGVLEELPFEADCASGAGWRYDDASAPSGIVLCANPCTAIQSQSSSDLEVIFGCTENPQIIRAIK